MLLLPNAFKVQKTSATWQFQNTHSSQRARSQKLAMGGCVWGSVGGAPSLRRSMKVWGRNPQPLEARGSGGRAHSARNFAFFCKNNLIFELFK